MIYRNHKSIDVLKSPHYMKHASAMTAEDLHGKADIAEELAWRDMQLDQLRAELAAEREKVKELTERLIAARGLRRSQATVNGDLNEQLAAAQATIEQMRKTLGKAKEGLVQWHVSENRYAALDAINDAIARPTNQDALHEALARDCERLADQVRNNWANIGSWLDEEAAAHRARKEQA